ncbi:MAG: NAD(P)H-dependent oxidoreductase [Candidatus Pacebacteria bacterium]|nr:NAD(P)H-dependent oxidoreductase [Candidatus Paceibacterota bacterium]
MSFLENLNWRYATKKFDSTKKVSDENLQKIRDAIRMAPTSQGLQMFYVVEATDMDLRNKLKEVSFNQDQVVSSDRLFIFCSRNDADSRVEEMFKLVSGGDDGIRKTVFENYEKMVSHFTGSMDSNALMEWSSRQAYLALGFGLFACAELNIDSCPMEGFDPFKVKEILGLGDEFTPVSYLAVGYRDENDERLKNPKFRFPESDIFLKK